MSHAAEISPVVLRAGFAAIKGTRHVSHKAVRLDAHGPVGDREWCLVDPARARVLSTVSTPLQMITTMGSSSGSLAVTLPGGRQVVERPEATGDPFVADYWGRSITATPHHGRVGEALAELVGRHALLCRVPRGAIVYGAPVSLLGSASLDDLAARMRTPQLREESERFRSTFLVETSRPAEEDTWLGRTIALDGAIVEVVGLIGRCGVPNQAPLTGKADLSVLKALAGYRPANARGEPIFGVEARVVRAGVVRGAPGPDAV
ncbi:MOSC domain-containing protein [Nocardioides daejeonensis]|uniref:MOSC domain-containing protein n=1 Tax=Nocardioides daejeonensis TaxID=1046556 RepID=UPI0013A5B799|nr:MOSC domain-containing protein [Nocardioides daejeonensis]